MKKGLKIWTIGDQSFPAFHCSVDPTSATVTGFSLLWLRMSLYTQNTKQKRNVPYRMCIFSHLTSSADPKKLFQVTSLPKIFMQVAITCKHTGTPDGGSSPHAWPSKLSLLRVKPSLRLLLKSYFCDFNY